jgi:hypothetical protein
VVIVEGQGDLSEVVAALGASRRIPHFLHSGHQQGDQHPDDGNDHQQLDQGETAAAWTVRIFHGSAASCSS